VTKLAQVLPLCVS